MDNLCPHESSIEKLRELKSKSNELVRPSDVFVTAKESDGKSGSHKQEYYL